MNMTKKQTTLTAAIAVLIYLLLWIIWSNQALEVHEFQINSDQIPESFTGFRIAQVSDLHNAEFGEGNSNLIELLAQTNPDIIVLTGDLIDSRRTDVKIALDFARQALAIAPVYYVSGNHEARVSEYWELKTGLTEIGVVILENDRIELARAGEQITLMGIQDPSFRESYLYGDSESIVMQAINALQNESDGYTILLSHRPERFETYVDAGVDLVFSGHAHGGQFRLPFIGGVVAPNQGLFPEYDAGLFSKENTNMIVSRGVGNSIIPIRFNNRPEIVVVTLRNVK